jgi:cyclophilin family peptidyl-prolyl cis-trans isomerase
MNHAFRAFLFATALLPLLAQAPPGAPAASPAQTTAPAPALKPRVKLVTNYGPIVLELDPEAAPQTVQNFLNYVKAGHFKGTIFHRVIEGFMIQGGGMDEDLKEKPTGAPIPNEAGRAFKAGLRNTRGTVAMARTSEPDSAQAQFFINTTDNVALDWKANTPEGTGYCAFGHVLEGMEVVDRIAKVKTGFLKGMANVPDYPVRIRNAELLP